MSCEGNRLKFFEQAQAALGMDARELEKVYQAGKAGGAQIGAAGKTRLLFQDMRAVGLQPPTHSADGLPKADSQAGYAAVFDHLRRNARPKPLDARELELDPDHLRNTWPLPIQPDSLLDQEARNGEGYRSHRYRSACGRHVWFGGSESESAYTLGDFMLGGAPFGSPSEQEAMRAYLGQKDADGLLADGYAPQGFDLRGYDSLGFSHYGLTQAEMADAEEIEELSRMNRTIGVPRLGRQTPKDILVDIEGFSVMDGFQPETPDEALDRDRFGYNRLGFKNGRSWTGVDENGDPAPLPKGYDAWGYERKTGLAAPDSAGRRHNLIGWVYDPAADECYDPQEPGRRMPHSGSFGYSAKLKKVILKRSYVPTEAEMQARLADPSVRWNEYRAGGGPVFRYAAILDQRDRAALLRFQRPEVRYLRSPQRLADNPDAALFGVPLRCPKCGQFTGAAPHTCSAHGNRKALVMGNGLVIGFARGAYQPTVYEEDDRRGRHRFGVAPSAFPDVYDDLLEALSRRYDKGLPLLEADQTGLEHRNLYTANAYMDSLLDLTWRREAGETALVLETPRAPLEEFDPDYEGGPLPGFHWQSGLSREGYDPYGFHYLTGKTRQGVNRRTLQALTRLKGMLEQADDLLRQKGKKAKDVLELTYSRIATALAGAGRRVTITEQGGPRPGMFWTDMRGRIQAERYPLQDTPQDSQANNLLAMKAGIYHELGHEEDTSPGIFARVLEIAHGREEVEGIPRNAAGLAAEVYNILEDGRMERAQAQRRRGVAAMLAADALINPRWDEKVGEAIPLSHQVMGLMLYRSLPFFRVRAEVLGAAPGRVRGVYKEVEPLVDRAMRSPQEAFEASLEITRRLIEADEDLRQFAEEMTAQSSQGGQWAFQPGDGQAGAGGTTLVISALPDLGSGASPDRNLSIPEPGWGEQEEQAGQKRGSGQQDDPSGRDSGAAGQGAGTSGSRSAVSPELNEDFFNGIAGQVSLDEVIGDLAGDLRQGMNAILRSPVGKALQRPLEAVGDILLEDPHDPDTPHTVRVLSPPGEDKPRRRADKALPALRAAAQAEGRQVARRLQALKEEIQRKARLQTSGALDRKRFKRALAGADTVYRQNRSYDLTSLAVSVQLDMSGSMHPFIKGGELAGAALALEEALQRLEAEYMVTGFGTDYALIKSFGDERIRDEQAAAMLSNDLGGTEAAPALRLGLLGLKETQSANKLHVVMTDGDFSDREAAAKQAEEMRRSGILPFGIYFRPRGVSYQPTQGLNRVFGDGNWVTIESLSDLSGVVARRIEQVYRKILATR